MNRENASLWFLTLVLVVTDFTPNTFHWSKHITGLQPNSRGQEGNLIYLVGPMKDTTWCQAIWGTFQG